MIYVKLKKDKINKNKLRYKNLQTMKISRRNVLNITLILKNFYKHAIFVQFLFSS
jgi:hypothetical protein